MTSPLARVGGGCRVGGFLGFFFLMAALASAAVPSFDVTLQSVTMDNLPIVTAITGYDSSEANILSTNQYPLMAPYTSFTDAWWDNLVSEQLQARLPVIFLSTCGSYNTNPACLTGPGNMNAYRLKSYIDALNRAGAGGKVKIGCFAEAAAQAIYMNYYGLPSNTLVDFSNTDSWNEVWWQRIVKPWFDTVPSSYWYTIGGKVPVEFWGLNITSIYTNQQGNISQLFNYLATQIYNTYGVYPFFIMGSLNCDTTLASCSYMLADNQWFSPPSTPYTVTTYKGFTCVGMVAGYTNSGYNTVGSSAYHNANGVILRNGVAGTGDNGDTMRAGLDAAVSNNAPLTIIEGYTDISESCGLYRSLDPDWDYPGQYLNILRSYTDLRTVTLRLDAEGCDEYYDTTTGNSGGAFLREGDLDVRPITGPQVISASSQDATYVAANAFDGSIDNKWLAPTPGPGWIEYDYGARNPVAVIAYTLTSGYDYHERDPMNWQFQGSNDGSSWTNLDTKSGVTFANRKQSNVYPISNTTAYRYYRLNVTAVSGGSTYGIQLAELSFTLAPSTNPRGWAVTNTAAGEWIQFDDVNFSAGNYKFPICYSSTASHTVRLLIDGTALADVVLPSSGSMDTFTTAYLGTKALPHGPHTLRLMFVDGGVDVDWIFVKKYDSLMTFQSLLTSCFVTAELGGNSTLSSNRTTASAWEKFSVDDQSGAGTVTSGDAVNLQSWDGLYLAATGNGGAGMTVNQRSTGAGTGFTIVKVGGSGAIANGNAVAFKTADGTHYLTVVNGTTLDASGTSIGTAQTFTASLLTQ